MHACLYVDLTCMNSKERVGFGSDFVVDMHAVIQILFGRWKGEHICIILVALPTKQYVLLCLFFVFCLANISYVNMNCQESLTPFLITLSHIHTVDYIAAALVQKEEYVKELLQDIRAERKHYKKIEAHQNTTLQRLNHELISVKVSRQGEETIADLQQQLREKDDRIQRLIKASEEKTTLDESHRALQESTETLEKIIEQQAAKLEVYNYSSDNSMTKRGIDCCSWFCPLLRLRDTKF